MLLVTSVRLVAQEDDDKEGNEKIRDKMSEYIQRRLDLSKDEAEKFTPVFIRYFKEWRQALRENRNDKLVLQQKVVELRLRYRDQFREIIGGPRGDQVFIHQERFIKEIRAIQQERLGNNPARPMRRRGR